MSAKSALLCSLKQRIAMAISSSAAIPVDMTAGLPVFATAVIRAWLVTSEEAILYKGTSSD